jgi:hypothetical protein
MTFVTIHQDVGFAEAGFAAAVEIFVEVAQLFEIGGGFGSFRVGQLETRVSAILSNINL